jgi:hypothetical protein
MFIACPAPRDETYGQVRPCGAQPGEGCNDRGYALDMPHGIHDERQRAWHALTLEEQRAAEVAAHLRGYYE